jgi:hypothetical protein
VTAKGVSNNATRTPLAFLPLPAASLLLHTGSTSAATVHSWLRSFPAQLLTLPNEQCSEAPQFSEVTYSTDLTRSGPHPRGCCLALVDAARCFSSVIANGSNLADIPGPECVPMAHGAATVVQLAHGSWSNFRGSRLFDHAA